MPPQHSITFLLWNRTKSLDLQNICSAFWEHQNTHTTRPCLPAGNAHFLYRVTSRISAYKKQANPYTPIKTRSPLRMTQNTTSMCQPTKPKCNKARKSLARCIPTHQRASTRQEPRTIFTGASDRMPLIGAARTKMKHASIALPCELREDFDKGRKNR